MKHLLIIGARGWGREIYNLLPDCIGYLTEFDVKGFLDDKSDALEGFSGYPKIIDSVENYLPQEDDVFICALGDVNWKKHYSEIILAKGGEFITLMHKTANVNRNSKIGHGCIITKDVNISCDIKIGNFVTFQPLSTMGGYTSLGDLVTVHPGAIILPHIKVGDKSTIGAGSVVIKKVKEEETVFGNPARKIVY